MAWVWSGLAWGLTGLGVVVLLWALWWDRVRGGPRRVRCGRCWYDLAGVVEIGEDGERPTGSRLHVVCPECGKEHQTLKSMRRTRRRWKWAFGAVGLWVVAHGVWSVPAVRARGWVGAVPSVGLVSMMAASSGAVGQPHGPSPVRWHGAAFDELRMRAWGWRGVGHPSPVDGWLTRRLVFVLARVCSSESVTDQSTVRGRMYHLVVNGSLWQGRAYGFEEGWARGVVWVEVTPRARITPGAPVWAEVRTRRLVSGAYRVELGSGEEAVWFEAFARDWGVFGPNPGPGMRLVEWRAATRSDFVTGISGGECGMFGVRGERGPQAVVMLLGEAEQAGSQVIERPLRILDRAGEDGPWVTRAEIRARASFAVDPGAGPELVGSDAVRQELERVMRAVLFPQQPSTGNQWHVMLDVMPVEVPRLDRAVTVGGAAELGSWRGTGADRAWVALARVPAGWWRVMPAGAERSEEEWWLQLYELFLPGGWESMPGLQWIGIPETDFDATEPVVLRIGVDGHGAAYADLGAERVFDGEIELNAGTTRGRLNQYRMTGTLLWDE